MKTHPRGALSPLKFLFPALALLLAASAPLAAQEGAVAGTVTDAESGVGLSTVDIQVLSGQGDVVARGVTSASGAFRIGGVSPGTYDLLFSVPGWETHRETGVEVTAGQLARVQVAMTPRTFNLNPITVTAGRSTQKLLDAPAAIQVVDQQEISRTIALTATEHVEGKAGVDVLRSGLQQSYVVARGFNNVFSGSMLVLNDYRLARVPSLRANIMHLNPSTNLDVDHVELVLGPASALYGPNAANGVLHVLTKSPIDDPGSTISVAGGFRGQDEIPEAAPSGATYDASTEGVVQAEGRFAWKASERFGAKISGQYFEGTDYFFLDPAEARARNAAQACLASPSFPQAAPCAVFNPSNSPTVEAFRTKLERVGQRDFSMEKWALDVRADWRPTDDAELVLSAGWNQAGSSIDLTGIGAGQVQDWLYSYYQARFNYKDLFAQFFVNNSDAGDTYILRTGNPIVDESYVMVGQLQHQLELGDRNSLTYGADLIRTVPQTQGTVNGRNEDEDEISEIGGYVQAESQLADRWTAVAALRVDKHSEIDDAVFSPRAALVYTPSEGHSVRATYNRAFSTPTTNNLFLDISAGTLPLGGSAAYDIRAMGTGGEGFTFRRIDGRPAMKSPFNVQDPTAFLPTTTQTLWQLAVGLVSQQSPQLAPALNDVPMPSEAEVPVVLRRFNTEFSEGSGQEPFVPAPGFESLDDIPAIKEQITNTFELGYKGLVNERLLIAADAWYEQRTDFVGPLRVETPNAFLEGQALGAYLVPRLTQELVQRGFSQQQAQATATQVATTMASAPLGSVQPENVSAAPSLMLTYRNFGDVDLWGADFRLRYNVDDVWTVQGAASYVNDELFSTEGDTIFLNAPSLKFSGGLEYSNDDTGLFGQLNGRYVGDFRMNSGVFVGALDSYFLTDVSLGYDLPSMPGASVQLQVQNLFDEGYRSVVGGAEMGRFSLLRLKYSF